MAFALLDPVVLTRDFPELGLRTGDVGTVVEVYREDAFEVEFVLPSGETKALVTLAPGDLRAVTSNDVLAVRAS